MQKRSVLAAALATTAICLWTPQGAEAVEAAREKIALRVLYVGEPNTDREKDFVGFLEKHFTKVGKADLEKVEVKDAEGFDVVVMDYGGLTIKGNAIVTPRMALDRYYSRPVMTIGAAGALACDMLGLKTGYL